MKQIPKGTILLLLFFGEMMASASVIFIRISSINPILLASFRMLVAVLFLLPFYFRELKRDHPGVKPFSPGDLKTALLPGLLLGLHFITWIFGARLVPAANASLIVNLTPMVSPLILLFAVGERVNRWEILGSLIAVAGCYFLARGDLNLNQAYFFGDMVILGAMVTFAFYQVLAKKRMTGLWRYVVPLYLIGGLSCLLAAIITGASFKGWTGGDWIAIFGLALLSTIGGHSIFNLAMRQIRGQIVSVFHTTQFIYAGIMGYFILNEMPSRSFLMVAPVILLGLLITIVGHPSDRKKSRREAGQDLTSQ